MPANGSNVRAESDSNVRSFASQVIGSRFLRQSFTFNKGSCATNFVASSPSRGTQPARFGGAFQIIPIRLWTLAVCAAISSGRVQFSGFSRRMSGVASAKFPFARQNPRSGHARRCLRAGLACLKKARGGQRSAMAAASAVGLAAGQRRCGGCNADKAGRNCVRP